MIADKEYVFCKKRDVRFCNVLVLNNCVKSNYDDWSIRVVATFLLKRSVQQNYMEKEEKEHEEV